MAALSSGLRCSRISFEQMRFGGVRGPFSTCTIPGANARATRSRTPCGQPIRRRLVRSSAATTTSAAETKTSPLLVARTKDELLRVIGGLGLPERAASSMEDFFDSYLQAVESSGVPDSERVAVRVMATVFDRILLQFRDPYTFPSHHTSIRAPYDYYQFGQNYVQPLIDYKHSFVGNAHVFERMTEQLAQGHNIVLLANHQTEADPAVLALMLEARFPQLATALTYVAGDRVVMDPFCKPFSMGRNLLCVHSKKHINDIPEQAEEKLAQNRHTLRLMAKLFKEGGNLIWVAPSGGRDRPDPLTDQWTPAAFDPSAVELMRRMAEDAGRPAHLHPLAILCYDIMPPPRQVEKQLGEKRVIGFHGVGIAVSPEEDFTAITAGIVDRKEARDAFSAAVFDRVVENYGVLFNAIHSGRGAAASTPDMALTQPWQHA